VLLAVGCGGTPAGSASKGRAAGPRLTPALAHALDAQLRAKVTETAIPGASAAIVFPDGREWAGAAGLAILHPRRPMTSQTSLAFDSVTKLAVAALALRLVEQHRLALEDPIARWYPRWRGDPHATVADLLGHTAGTRDPSDAQVTAAARRHGGGLTPRQLIGVAPTPGPRTTEAEYSNVGFLIAGAVLARAAGTPVATALRRDVFDAPGGAGLAMQPGERPHPPLAHSYSYPRGLGDPVDTSDGSPFIPNRGYVTAVSTAGALAGDDPSLARWAHQLLGGHILAPQSLRAMSRFHPGGNWEAYGLGLARDSLDGRTMIGHGGDGLGSHTELWHLPRENLTIAVTWNDGSLDREGNIFQALLRTALG
jgi:D-alanyl-D-alanine carboxypeptidase